MSGRWKQKLKLKICTLRNREERKQARENQARQEGEAKGGEGSAAEKWSLEKTEAWKSLPHHPTCD